MPLEWFRRSFATGREACSRAPRLAPAHGGSPEVELRRRTGSARQGLEPGRLDPRGSHPGQGSRGHRRGERRQRRGAGALERRGAGVAVGGDRARLLREVRQRREIVPRSRSLRSDAQSPRRRPPRAGRGLDARFRRRSPRRAAGHHRLRRRRGGRKRGPAHVEHGVREDLAAAPLCRRGPDPQRVRGHLARSSRSGAGLVLDGERTAQRRERGALVRQVRTEDRRRYRERERHGR